MSVLVTSNIHKHETGFPYGTQPLYELSPVLNALEAQKVPFDFFDSQAKSEDEWFSHIGSTQSKIVVIQLNEPYIQFLSRVKLKLADKTIIVCTEDQSLIQVLVFDYEIDYVCFDLNGLPELISTASNAFAPFYDHIKGIAYKNGLGELTNTGVSGLDKVSAETNDKLVASYDQPISQYENALTDFISYKSTKEYDAFYLKLPSSKKAMKIVRKIIEENEIDNNLFVYPSCDVNEDKKFYTRMGLMIDLLIQKQSAGFFKRIGINRKLNKL